MKCKPLSFQNFGLDLGFLDLKSEHLLLFSSTPSLCASAPAVSAYVSELNRNWGFSESLSTPGPG